MIINPLQLDHETLICMKMLNCLWLPLMQEITHNSVPTRTGSTGALEWSQTILAVHELSSIAFWPTLATVCILMNRTGLRIGPKLITASALDSVLSPKVKVRNRTGLC